MSVSIAIKVSKRKKVSMNISRNGIITSLYLKGFIILLTDYTLLKQFQHFCHRNKVTDFEKGLEFFAIFGGLDEQINLTQPLFEVVKTKLLDKYGLVHKAICNLYESNAQNQAILSAIALSDGREHAVFKRARVSVHDGEKIVDDLLEAGIIYNLRPKHSKHRTKEENEQLSNKLYFKSPVVRFWFAFVSPFFKGIKEKKYEESKERFEKYFDNFVHLTFLELSKEMLKKSFEDDFLSDVNEYWEKDLNIDIMAKTKSRKVLVCSCKYSNAKVKKSELKNLQEQCEKAKIKPDIFVLFSKRGFSNELKNQKGENLKLFSVKNLKSLTK